MQQMVHAANGWCLERNDRLVRLTVESRGVLFEDTGQAQSSRHSSPAWKFVIALGRDVVLDGVSVEGAIIPPGVEHECSARTGFMAMYFDPWELAGPQSITSMTPAQAGRIRSAMSDFGKSRGGLQEVPRMFGPARSIDDRLAYVLTRLDSTDPIPTLAKEAGLSAARLRALSGQATGVPLVAIRQWVRLRASMASLGHAPIGDVAAAGQYADQPHFTRSTQRFLGRTPGSILAR